eukprot:gb/GECH01010271.1/.p1 GENE.gb/GECH01010271.1/~~gb/GECH01010271.1/.p1  ORF type:complete len:109 (+),score=23.54 gb/GECH01010271.1/:1-327(+)
MSLEQQSKLLSITRLPFKLLACLFRDGNDFNASLAPLIFSALVSESNDRFFSLTSTDEEISVIIDEKTWNECSTELMVECNIVWIPISIQHKKKNSLAFFILVFQMKN